MTSEISPRYAELYEYYRNYFIDYQASQGQPSDADAAHAYAAEHGAAAFVAEGGTPPSADVRPGAVAEPAPVADVVPSVPAVEQPAVEQPVVNEAVPAETVGEVPTVSPAPDAFAPVVAPVPTAAPVAAPGVVSAPSAAPAHAAPHAAAAPSAGVQAGMTAPAFAAAPTAPRKRRTGLLIGLIAGGLALVLVVVAAIVVVPQLLGGGQASSSRIADLRTEPSVSWTYKADARESDYTDDVSFAALSGDRMLVVSSFDYYGWSSDNSDDGYSLVDWYEGIDEDYEAGYQAGLAYEAAVDAAFDDFSLPFPKREDYYPAEFGGVAPFDATFEEEHAGAFAGWYDAYFGDDHGTSLPSKPVTPNDKSSIALVSATSGEELWNVAVTDVLPDHDPADSFSVRAGGANDQFLVVYDYGYRGRADMESSVIALLNTANGEVTSTLEVDGFINSATIVGDALIAVVLEEAGDDTYDASVIPFSLSKLTAEPEWTIEVDAEEPPYVSAAGIAEFSLTSTGSDTTEVEYYSATTGKETALSDGRRIITIGDTRIALDESEEDVIEFAALDASGKEKWTLEGGYYRIVDGTLFVWESCDDECDDLAPVNLASGELRWKKGLDRTVPLAIEGDRLLVQRMDKNGAPERQLEWVSFSSGEELDADAPKVPADVDPSSMWIAKSMLYTTESDELAGYSFTERKALWEYGLDDDERLRALGGKLYIWDAKKLELSLLVED